MTDATIDAEFFRSLELSLMRLDRRLPTTLAALLSDSFVEFGSSGRVYDKDAALAALTGGRPDDDAIPPTITDFVVRPLAADAVLITYRTAMAGQDRYVLRSSIWKKSRKGWEMIFHQGTPAE